MFYKLILLSSIFVSTTKFVNAQWVESFVHNQTAGSIVVIAHVHRVENLSSGREKRHYFCQFQSPNEEGIRPIDSNYSHCLIEIEIDPNSQIAGNGKQAINTAIATLQERFSKDKDYTNAKYDWFTGFYAFYRERPDDSFDIVSAH